ncbi:hypothetical protein AB431_08415 [Mycobacterium sp. EPa45]|nr:hypothetical protein AB431_08415 [Mycobacterium sp. EPa45]
MGDSLQQQLDRLPAESCECHLATQMHSGGAMSAHILLLAWMMSGIERRLTAYRKRPLRTFVATNLL